MRFAVLGTAVLMSVAACATRSAAPAAPVAPVDAEDAARLAYANQLRQRIFAETRWEEPETDTPCDQGALRTSGGDSTSSSARLDTLVRALERTIIASGIDERLDSPAAHALLRTVVAWEAGDARPRWDVPAGVEPKRTVPAGLTGEYYNTDTKRCVALAPQDTFTFVVPAVAGWNAPKVKTAVLEIVQSDTALVRVRDRYFAAHTTGPNPSFLYTRVGPVIVWRDYAVVAVNRPAERRGAVELQKGAGGATYIFRRTGDEWRLLVIARTWT